MAEGLHWRQGHGIDPVREWMRRVLPGPAQGVVIIDLDYAFRRYGERLGLDREGDLLLIEKKEYEGTVTGGEKAVMRWIDNALRASGTHGNRYRGASLLRVRYRTEPTICDKCKQPRENSDEAYERFLGADLEWGDRTVSHEELASILLGELVNA